MSDPKWQGEVARGLLGHIVAVVLLLSALAGGFPAYADSPRQDEVSYILFDGPEWFVVGMAQAVGQMRDVSFGEWWFQWMRRKEITIKHWDGAPSEFMVGYTVENKTIWIGRGIALDSATNGAMLALAATYLLQYQYQPDCPSPWINAVPWAVGYAIGEMMDVSEEYGEYLRIQATGWYDRVRQAGEIPASCSIWH